MPTKTSKDQDLAAIPDVVWWLVLRTSPEVADNLRHFVDDHCTRDAYVENDASGTLKSRRLHQSGRELEGNASYVDSQSVALHSTPERESPLRPANEIAADTSLSVHERVDAIQHWLIEAPEAAATFILEALAAEPSHTDFRDALVFLAEDARYRSTSDRDALATLLKRIATEIIESRTPNAEHVAWAAIRRFASLVPVERIDELRVFLRNSGGVDTRLVALQGILYAVESQPIAAEVLPELRGRIFEMAVKLIDADVLTPGDNSAVLELSLCALMALSDPRAEDCIGQVQRLGWNWLTNQLFSGLRELRDGWNEHSGDEFVQNAIRRVSAIVD